MAVLCAPPLPVPLVTYCLLVVMTCTVVRLSTGSDAVLSRDCPSVSTTHNTYTCTKNTSSGISEEIVYATWLVDGRDEFNQTLFSVPEFIVHGILIADNRAVTNATTFECVLELESGQKLTSDIYHLATDGVCPNPTPVITPSTVTTPFDEILPDTSPTSYSDSTTNEVNVPGSGIGIPSTSDNTTGSGDRITSTSDNNELTITESGTTPTPVPESKNLGLLGLLVFGIPIGVIIVIVLYCKCKSGRGGNLNTSVLPIVDTDTNPLPPYPNISSVGAVITEPPTGSIRLRTTTTTTQEPPKQRNDRELEAGGSNGITVNGQGDVVNFPPAYPTLEKPPSQEEITHMPPSMDNN